MILNIQGTFYLNLQHKRGMLKTPQKEKGDVG
ncbi:hypothetical protein HCEICBPK_00380 [[Clostridium] scindens]|nr:hypothetical protein HCEICBPK_00380 [[Clostridium] scindens]